jgi:hypothetical protein
MAKVLLFALLLLGLGVASTTVTADGGDPPPGCSHCK